MSTRKLALTNNTFFYKYLQIKKSIVATDTVMCTLITKIRQINVKDGKIQETHANNLPDENKLCYHCTLLLTENVSTTVAINKVPIYTTTD